MLIDKNSLNCLIDDMKPKNFYHGFDVINYFHFKEQKFYHAIIAEIKAEFESFDAKIRNSAARKSSGYAIKGYVPRTVITIFGKITFIRTKYIYFDQVTKKQRTIFLVDKYLKIEPYKRIDLNLRLAILKALGKGKRQQDILDQFKFANLSRVSISNLAKTINVQRLNEISALTYQPPIDEITTKPYIYLNIDDTFMSFRHNKNKGTYRIRLAVAHLGYTNSNQTQKRKELLEKRAFYLIDEIPTIKNELRIQQFAKFVRERLQFFYGDISNKKIIICGDSAAWIQELAHLLNADFVLDKYHVTNLFYKMFPHQRKRKRVIKNPRRLIIEKSHKFFYEQFFQLLSNGKTEAMIDYLKTINQLQLLQKRSVKIKELITYLNNHKNGIINYQNAYYIGSQTEAMISHIVKSIGGYGAKLYNLQTFKNLLNLKIASINHLNPLMIYYHQSLKKIDDN